jgi:Fe/S biogenesis protein NfuA
LAETPGVNDVIGFSESARNRIKEFIQEEGDDDLAVRIEVLSSSPLAPEYDMALVGRDELGPDDRLFEADGLSVAVDAKSASLLEGTQVDWIESVQGSGFKFENPNLKPIGSEPVTGPLTDRVKQVIDERINPGIAMHGGHVTLVEVREDVAYLEMSGGCQGCGMAAVTLKQGIERMLTEEVPEIQGVVDVTDHTSGDNPYYQ